MRPAQLVQSVASRLPSFLKKNHLFYEQGPSHEQHTPRKRGDNSSTKSDGDNDVDVLLTPPNKVRDTTTQTVGLL